MTTCDGHSPGCAGRPPMMRRLQPGVVTLLTPHSRGSDRSDDDNVEDDTDIDVVDGLADDEGDLDDEIGVVSLSFSSVGRAKHQFSFCCVAKALSCLQMNYMSVYGFISQTGCLAVITTDV